MVAISAQISELDLENFAGQLTQVITLSPISWQTYQAMLADMGDHRSTRTAYNQGTLTLKMPSKLHEIINRLLARIVKTLTEELDLEVVDVGSMTLVRPDLEKGAEPDTGFYLQNASRLEGLDPEIPEHLPPDLVIEVDITNPSTQRLEIYQALGVPEVWQYTKLRGLVIYQLRSPAYFEAEVSGVFPQVTAAQLNLFLEQRQSQGENQVIRAVRSWIQEL
ncbi:Uma2 family endonuclease [Almyronema epifaneia]|uniref:Uma2 family endonuclease n=1 Tax=Almyronema epifaneia S1 TaxID=2991925 RepID=A0ABW6IGP0_9CYAN